MKKVFFLLPLWFLSIIDGYCQEKYDYVFPLNAEGTEYEFTKIIEVNKPKSEIFKNAKVWIAKTYGSKDVVGIDDYSTGKIIAKGVVSNSFFIFPRSKYSITIDCRERKYRITIDGFNYIGVSDLKIIKTWQESASKETDFDKKQVLLRRIEENKGNLDSIKKEILYLIDSAVKSIAKSDDF